MLHPAPVSQLAPHLARGTLDEIIEATATTPAHLVLTVPNTSYRLYLEPVGGITDAMRERLGKRLIGTIRAKARRIDVVQTGGRYVEPVYGRPRRVQGAVLAIDEGANTITIGAGVPIVVKPTDARQKAADFALGDFVTFGVLPGATIEVVEG